MYWDLLQQYQIRNNQIATSSVARSASQLESENAELRRSIDTLVLACHAMWEVLRERGGLTDQMLLERMREIDGRDGQVDGKMSAAATRCPSCSRFSSAKTGRCVYCGAELPSGPSPFGR